MCIRDSGALLAALATKGETSDEITGAARAMREHAIQVDTGGADVLDIVDCRRRERRENGNTGTDLSVPRVTLLPQLLDRLFIVQLGQNQDAESGRLHS